MMQKLGFSDRWIRMVMMCIPAVTYSFKLNGDPVGYVHPERGIRQGDPLSLYLFVMCADGLSTLLTRAELDEDLQGIKVCRVAPSIHHLLFTDDSFLFAQVRKSKKEMFAYVKDKVWKKLQSWKGGLLSSAGRELLVKTVAQALPMYSMQCFLVPKMFCEELNMMIAKVLVEWRSRIWHFGRHGKYTVRNAYHVARGINVANREGAVGSSSFSSIIGEKL
ncbi:uncharacterized protein LOC126590290 [Malus sylvestris]|uniref:uncharacterized protein LOC126590290 n=1 Tax=Malus sylvestris TaxID=3752 RepID=UPI0021AC3423|nr:uncharacterized protein LOC126590290 [Malus sylvestris]